MTTNVHRCMDFDFCYHPRPYEVELIELVSRGLQRKQIAHHLRLSPSTIRNRLTVLYAALDVRDRASLVRRAVELGLLTIERTN